MTLSPRRTVLVPLLPQPTGTGSRDTAYSTPVSGVSPRRGIGSRVSSRTAMWPCSRLVYRGEQTLPGPVWRIRRQSATTLPRCRDAVPGSPDGSTRENGWRSPAMNAIHGIVTVRGSPRPSSGPFPGCCCRGTFKTAGEPGTGYSSPSPGREQWRVFAFLAAPAGGTSHRHPGRVRFRYSPSHDFNSSSGNGSEKLSGTVTLPLRTSGCRSPRD